MDTQLWTKIAILVAFIVAWIPHFIKWWHNKALRRIIKKILISNLSQLESNLVIIRGKDDGERNPMDRITFDKTSISEIEGYYFLFTDLLIRYPVENKLDEYPKTIEFFNHYKINTTTAKSKGHLTLGTVNNLLMRLKESRQELDW